jgi:hypothetical protein
MGFDLSWLWEFLNSIGSTINSWFSTIWTQAVNIINTGQGIFSGLIAFGSQLWDAILKFGETVGQFFQDAYNYLATGITNAFNVFGQWLNNAFTFLSEGVTWIGNQLYNFGNWFYNSVLYIWNWIVNTATGIWTALTEWFSGVATALGTWWGSVTTSINTWWSNLLIGFRNKIITTIQADIAISMAWKASERILNPSKLEDVGYGLFGMVASPLVGRLLGELVNAIVPMPATTTYPLIPTIGGFSYTPPSLNITTPTEKSPPTPSVSGAPSGVFTGVSESSRILSEYGYEVSIMSGQSVSREMIGLSYEVEVT